MKIQFSLKTFVLLVVVGSLTVGFSLMTMQQRNEIRELKVQLDRRNEFSSRSAAFYSKLADLKAERKEIAEKWSDAHPSAQGLDKRISQLENEIPLLWEMEKQSMLKQ